MQDGDNDVFSQAFMLGHNTRKRNGQLNTNPFDPESESKQYEDFQDGFAQATAEANAFDTQGRN